MQRNGALRWTVLVPVLLAGIVTGLIVAGMGDGTPSARATAAALEALASPAEAASDSDPAAVIPASLVEPDPTVTVIQQGGLPSLRDVAARVRPAAVSIAVRGFREVTVSEFNMPSIPEEFRRYFQMPPEEEDVEPRNRGPRREPFSGEGSGFIFSADGFIITNFHVVDGAEEITVTLPDKRRFEAELIGKDELTDVAVVKIDTEEELPTVELGDSEQLQIGDWVVAVGCPLEFDYTVTAGIVSAKNRNLDLGPIEGNVRQGIQDYIQTDAVINRGNSGGPLVDLAGRVVGINTAIASTTGLYAGYGFAVPINLARSVARDLISYGRVRRSWLGILFQPDPVDADIAAARRLPYNPPIGILITDITPDSPAAEAGLETDDILLTINGEPIDTGGELQTLVSTTAPGTDIEVEIYRGGNSRRAGRVMTLTVTLQERPDNTTPAQSDEEETGTDRLGLDVVELDRDTAGELGFSGRGLFVQGVETFGPAYDAGLRSGGFVLLAVDGEPVRSVRAYEQVLEELEAGAYIMIKIWVPPVGATEGQEVTRPIRVR